MPDMDAVTNPSDDEADRYESGRPLSDEQLAELGYLERPPNRTVSVKPQGAAHWKEHRFDRDAEEAVPEDQQSEVNGSGATADDVADEADLHESDRLDEGLEETFPASDPVSTKHIT